MSSAFRSEPPRVKMGWGMLACLSTKERCVSLDNASGWIASQSSGTMNAKGTKNQPQQMFVASIQNHVMESGFFRACERWVMHGGAV
jgi:hypothetical protein